MARNGAGTYVLPAGQPVVTGTTISSATHNTLATDLANALTTSIATDGQSVVTANIPFGGYKLMGLGAAAVNGDALRFEDKTALIAAAQAQTYTAFTTAGTSTAYTLTPTPAITSLVANQRFRVKFNAANGATPTLAISGLAATALKVYDATGAKAAPAVGALGLNMLADVEYDGTDYVVLNPPALAATATSSGIVELSTAAEYITGTDPARVPSVKVLRDNQIVLGTPVASTSGTSIDFTGIPAWVKRVTIMLKGVSANASSPYVVQIGDSGGIETSGYLGTVVSINSGATVGIESFSTGFIINRNGAIADIAHGSVVLTLLDASTNSWTLTSSIALSDSNFINQTAGSKALSATLDRVRLTTSGGTATFDAGSVNILYE